MMQQAVGVLFFLLLCGGVYGQNLTLAGGAPSGRIVNGTTASQRYPFLVALLNKDGQFCGASIITLTHALTAAHCLEDYPAPDSLALRGGSNSDKSGGVIFYVGYYVLHPNYNKASLDQDAAIITIIGSFGGYPNIGVIPLQESEIAPTWCYAVGWGYTDGTAQTNPDSLQFAFLELQSFSKCYAAWGRGYTPQMICAKTPNVDICNGDSGGPLVCNNRLTGIASFVYDNCTGIKPAVFAKVASPSIRSFIRANAGI
uniref:Peptidase S1 domain-containing protein n=1 Tax=Anopheles atroparvus TaxID=41427 RepID=A0AAG5DRW6_ANOAO